MGMQRINPYPHARPYRQCFALEIRNPNIEIPNLVLRIWCFVLPMRSIGGVPLDPERKRGTR